MSVDDTQTLAAAAAGPMDPFKPRKNPAPAPTGEAMALEALAWLGDNPQLLERFLALAGIAPADLRRAAKEPGFLCGVLDFFAGDEAALLALAAATGRDPRQIANARERMAGTSQ
jgi:hypothetical protein